MARQDAVAAAADHNEVRRKIEADLALGKDEGFVLEEAITVYGIARPQAKMLLDMAVPGRTPENPIRFTVDPTPRRRCSAHIDRLPAVQQEHAALVASGRPPRVQTPGPAVEGTEHLLFAKGKRQLLKVKPRCSRREHKWICITHGMVFATIDELHDHCADAGEHNTTSTEFDAPTIGEGHVTAVWCEEIARETTQHWMGALQPLWIQHGLEATPKTR